MKFKNLDQIYYLVWIILGLLTIIGVITGFFKRLYYRFIRYIVNKYSNRYKIPKTTLTFVYKPTLSRWSMGKHNGKPCMHVHTIWHITNIIGEDILVTGACTKRPKTHGSVSVCATVDITDYYGEYYIPGHETRDASIDFTIQPPVKKEGKKLKLDIIATDQFNNKHKIKNIVVNYRK